MAAELGDGRVDLAAERVELARACRVLAYRGLVDDVLGHVSLRVGAHSLLVRCRGPRESGLRFTTPDDIRLVDLDTEPAAELDDGYRVPNELPIHTEILRYRPAVRSVVHAHPRSVVVAGLAGLSLLPIVGAFDIPTMRLAESGIAVFPRAVLIRRRDLATELLAAMGRAEACTLIGHGLVTTGATIAAAVLRALSVNTLASLSLEVVRAGGVLRAIPDGDRAELPDLGGGFNETMLWNHHLACSSADGWDLDAAQPW